MNFINTFKAGQLGENMGRTTGIDALDLAIGGLQKKVSICVAAAAKVGKTTLADFCFIISPYLEAERNGTLDDIDWIYLSYEIDRVSKEFKFAAFFMFYDYGIATFDYKGKTYEMSQDYLMGRLFIIHQDKTRELVPVSEDHQEKLRVIYERRIEPLFGEYSDNNKLIAPGKIKFISEAENPTGVYKMLSHYASQRGRFLEEDYETLDETGRVVWKKRRVGYVADTPKHETVVVVDHIRKLSDERNFTKKQVIDKFLEYTTILRNLCGFTFIYIVHSNRGVSNVDRLRMSGEYIFPTADDIKDSGNVAEESTIVMTLFNPHDEKYNLKKHFGVELKDNPNYRSLHITESRYTFCPVHIRLNMFGGINYFNQLNKALCG